MKRSLVFIAIIALAVFALSGCQFVIGFIFETDLYVENIEPAFNGEEFTGVDVRIRNDGAKEEDVGYDVVLSPDPSADYGDHVLYSDQFNIDFKDEINLWVSVDSMDLGGIDLGDYYIGVILDLDDSDNSNNDATTRDTIHYDGGGGGGLDPDGFETNDSFSQYAVFTQGWDNWHYANLHTGTDHDWFDVYQMQDMDLWIQTRPGPGGMDVSLWVDVYNSDDITMTMPAYSDGSWTNHDIEIDMSLAPGTDQYWRVHIYSPSGEIGEYEIQAYQ